MPSESEQGKPSGGRILVVEDEAPLRRALVRLLEREGFEVEPAGDGVEALESLRRRLPDLILLDIRMPRLGGLGFLEGMRRAGWSVGRPS
jgi:CheY-like chemotaxis protein